MSIPVTKIFDSLAGVKREGGAYALPEELDASAFINLGQEAMQIPRISRVEVSNELVIISTHKGERFYFAPDHVIGLKFGAPAAKAARSSAGFSA